jgi:hypothetical protein
MCERDTPYWLCDVKDRCGVMMVNRCLKSVIRVASSSKAAASLDRLAAGHEYIHATDDNQ